MEEGKTKETLIEAKAPAEKPLVEKPLVKEFPKWKFPKSTLLMVIGALIIVLAGVGTGWLLSGKTSSGKGSQPTTSSNAMNSPDEAGIADEKAFKDTTEGTLASGGIKGEGTHHLDRGTGESQYVYLTSTVIDLDTFLGKKVQVWGETSSAKSAGWLMDVGRIKVVK